MTDPNNQTKVVVIHSVQVGEDDESQHDNTVSHHWNLITSNAIFSISDATIFNARNLIALNKSGTKAILSLQ